MKNSKDKSLSNLDFEAMWERRQEFLDNLSPEKHQQVSAEGGIQEFISFLPLPNAFSMKSLHEMNQSRLDTLRDLTED